MRVNHLIIGCDDVKQTRTFYEDIMGLTYVDMFIDTGTKKEGYVLTVTQKDMLDILLVPFREERLPSPQHIAFEVESNLFDEILNRAEEKKLNIRAMPPLDCKILGVGTTEVRGVKFERFYLLDPSRVNIEVMRRC